MLEQRENHDDMWNVTQLQLARQGGMYGFVSITSNKLDSKMVAARVRVPQTFAHILPRALCIQGQCIHSKHCRMHSDPLVSYNIFVNFQMRMYWAKKILE